MKIKLQISSSSFADSKNKPHVAWGTYEIMVATNAVLRHDFTNLRNFALLSAWCIYLLIFKKTCKQISLCSRLDRYPSCQSQFVWKCWISASEHPHSVWKWKTRLREVAGIQEIVCACDRKASSIGFICFCLLRETALRRQEALPFIQSRTSPIV